MVQVKKKYIVFSVILSAILVFIGTYKISSFCSKEQICKVRVIWKDAVNKLLDDSDSNLNEIYKESERKFFSLNLKPIYEDGGFIVEIASANIPSFGSNSHDNRIGSKYNLYNDTNGSLYIAKTISKDMAANILKRLDSYNDMINAEISFLTKFYLKFNPSIDVSILQNTIKKLINEVKFIMKNDEGTKNYFLNYIFDFGNLYFRRVIHTENVSNSYIKARSVTSSSITKHISTAYNETNSLSMRDIIIILIDILAENDK
ncbi:hypothetical protein EDEG_03779 [Edhazardia aedis USNM 41457]|uniref:Uncharacterized protein n=1 Tax=Edhazardia aedis (strain USNM 41457) TaxID=1003232 RepID=J9D296_EDHAE|nr:hypothetical protein EDEG_03779 [Edhazardia aedis USNM 41457]|eukprot:EJW01699.1 hypothetical protein EDEG_03779 [Edhazardia aedis USNM 41457]